MSSVKTLGGDADYMSIDEALAHYGIKGMKWGVRKDDGSKPRSARRQRYDDLRSRPLETMSVKTRNGVLINIEETREPKITSFILSFSKTAMKEVQSSRSFDLKVDGKNVGTASFSWRSSTEMNLTWLTVNKFEQGKGYGTAVFDAAVQYAKKGGARKLTLEVPGDAPNARHIYEKQGFVAGKQITPSNDAWGGLTEMSLDLRKKSVAHDAITESDELELALRETFGELPEDLEESDDTPEDLKHYGVKGMKWGVRKDDYNKLSRGEKRQAKRDFKADAKWEKQYGSDRFKVAMYNDIADQINARIGTINDKYKGKDIRDWSRGDGLEYVNEYKDLVQRSAENSLKRMVPDSPSGKYTTRVELDPLKEMFPRIYIVEKEVKHADDEPLEMEIRFIWKNNRIVKVKPITLEDLAHSLLLDGYSEDDVVDILVHYGVKGMKWGVRRPVGPDGLIKRAGKVITDDAKQVGATAKKAGGAVVGKARRYNDANRPLVREAQQMSHDEIKRKVQKLRLEKEYIDLTGEISQRNKTKLQEWLSTPVKQVETSTRNSVNETIDAEIKKQAKKVAARAAARAAVKVATGV